eukprot:Gb_28000 [translate_table: standard]
MTKFGVKEVVKACSGKFHPLFQFFYFDSLESLLVDPLENGGSQGICCWSWSSSMRVPEKLGSHESFLWESGKLTMSDYGVEALQNHASPDTANVFDDTFWEILGVVINALDNVNARLYIDSKCLYFKKPLLDSGTLGTMCNTQMVIPRLIQNDGASRDPPEKQAPMRWSSLGLLERVVERLVIVRCVPFEDCVAWAQRQFEEYFANRVKQLTFTFLENAATSIGAPLWENLGANVYLHGIGASSTFGKVESYGIPILDWALNSKKLAEAADKVQVLVFQRKQGMEIVTDEKVTNLNPSTLEDTAISSD